MTSNVTPCSPRVFLAHSTAGVVAGWRRAVQSDCGWQVAGTTNELDVLILAMARPDIDIFLISTGFLAMLPRAVRSVVGLGNPLALLIGAAEGRDWIELHAALDCGACDLVVPGEDASVWQARIYRRWAEATDRQRVLSSREGLDSRQQLDKIEEPAGDNRAIRVMVSGGDGGTGKSFSALQLAGILARHAAARVCLIDGDLRYAPLGGLIRQSDSHDRSLADIGPVLPELSWHHVASVLQTHPLGFSWLAGAPGGIADVDESDLFARVLDISVEHFDVIIVDWPAPGPAANIAALVDQIWLVMTPDRSSATCARSLAIGLKTCGEEPYVRAIVNRCDRPGDLKLPELERLAGLEIAAALPEDAGAGILFDRDGAVLAERTDLAITRSLVPIAQRIKPFDDLAQPRRLWQRLIG